MRRFIRPVAERPLQGRLSQHALGGDANASKDPHPPILQSAAFTMLEVILALGLAVVLMAALQQSLAMLLRYQRAAQKEVHEAHLARTLLYRIAEELRTTTPPFATEASVRPLRTLVDLVRSPLDQPSGLDFGSFSPDPSTAAFASEQGEQATLDSLMTLNQLNAVILGGPDRLLLVHRPPVLTPMHRHRFPDFEEGNPAGSTGTLLPSQPTGGRGVDAGTMEDQLRSAGVLTQVLYFLRPLEEAEMASSQGSTARSEDRGADRLVDWGTTEEPRPAVRGLFRQEVTLPIAPVVQFEARAQLDDLLRDAREGDSRDEDQRPSADAGGAGQGNAGDRSDEDVRRFVSTRLLLEELTCIRFRYHNGFAWQDRWERVDRLPLAVEIRLSFDPRAADPEFLSEYLEEEDIPAASTGLDGADINTSGFAADPNVGVAPSGVQDPLANVPTTSFDDQRADRPILFPYRLVVHLPANTSRTQEWRPPDPFSEGSSMQGLEP